MSTRSVEVLQVARFPSWTDARLREHFTVHDYAGAKDGKALLAEVAGRVRGIATFGAVGADRALIEALPKLEIISCFAVGVDAIDLAAAREREVIVTNTPDVLNDCVADLGMALVLSVLRRIPQADAYVRAGKWVGVTSFPLTRSLKGKTLGIVGLGRIGLGLAQRAEGFGMRIAYHNRNRRDDVPYAYHASPAALAAASDVIACTCPGGAATRHLIDAEVLAALGPEGYLVNISRGSVVDEAALVDALTSRKIAGAGLDVFENEPTVPEALKGLDTVVLAPHMGSGTVETRTAMGDLMIDNLIAHFSGKPPLTPVA